MAELNIALTMSEKQEVTVENTPTLDDENTEKVKNIPTTDEPPLDNAVNFRGVSPSPVSERAIQDMKLIPGNPNIYLHPLTDGQQYRGEAIHVDTERGFCVQLNGRQSLFVHDLKNLERTPSVGENIRLAYPRYRGHKAAVIHQETQNRTQAQVRV